MDVQVIQDQEHLPIDSSSVVALVKDFLTFHEVDFDEVSIHFVDTAVISHLHAQFFDDPSPTDCISFPMDDSNEEGYRMMGDVFICPETASAYVASNGGDAYHEVTLYLVHGLLHLLGFDDIDEEDRLLMRSEEKRYLSHVSKKNMWLYT